MSHKTLTKEKNYKPKITKTLPPCFLFSLFLQQKNDLRRTDRLFFNLLKNYF